MSMKYFLTGATGLLGSCLVGKLENLGEVTATRHQTAAPAGKSFLQIDLNDEAAIASALNNKGYTHLVHCAALRYPEKCQADPASAYRINSVAVEYLAAACNRNRIKLIFISSDYVFPGISPPYREECKPMPVNVYGRSKLAGEFAARSADEHLVIRVPALWSNDPDDPRSPLKDFLVKLRSGKSFPADNHLIRHYTLADDVAAAIAFCVGKEMSGTIHLSASESQTKADFVRAVARHYRLNPELVINAPVAENDDKRPQDSSMSIDLYRSRGGPHIRGLSEVFTDREKEN